MYKETEHIESYNNEANCEKKAKNVNNVYSNFFNGIMKMRGKKTTGR